ncbi:hypothetical protein JTB14_021307 [Gonioctena quinquepunctata]|nr:hypothetical protein JTB14_021307 [Gonioctena quinquepunctata]
MEMMTRRRKCCVEQCHNKFGRRHRFPKTNPEAFKAWVERIKPRNHEILSEEQIYNTFVICEEHFSPEYFVPGSRRGLSYHAVPTLKIPGVGEDCPKTEISIQEPLAVNNGKSAIRSSKNGSDSSIIHSDTESITGSQQTAISEDKENFGNRPKGSLKNNPVLSIHVTTGNNTEGQQITVEEDDDEEEEEENKADLMEVPLERVGRNSSKKSSTQIVCRTCAKTCPRYYSIKSNICNFSTTIEDMVILLVPQMKFVLDDKDVVCGSCRMALIYCVRFIDRCLKAEANRKDSLVCLEDPLDELEDGSNIIQDDSLPDVAHNKPSTIIDLKLSNNFQDDGSSQVNEYFERCEEAIDQVIDITKNEHDYSISNDNLQDEHTKTNDSDDNLQDESAKALSNDSSNDDEIECGEALPNNILVTIELYLLSNPVMRNFHFQDLEQTSKKKRVLLIASSFKCRRCSEYFSTNGNYNSHMRNHRRYEERRVAREKLRQLRLQKKEDIVRKRLASQMNPPLKKKYRKTQNDLQCKTCSHVCSSKDDLQLHIKTHPHIVCEQCGKGFATTGQLGAHKNVHNDPNSYICEICGKAYKTIGQLRVHGQNHENKVFLCSKCPKVFKMKIGLSRHVKYTHGEGLDKLWSCKVCGKLFKVSGALKSHYCQTHLRDGPLKCEVCGQGFFRTDYLKRHKRRHVIYGDGIPVPVPLKRARKSDDTETNGSETVLRRRRHHWPPGPYECQICKKLFKKIENLKLHIERHSLLSRYSCKYCNMSFKIKYQRNRHEKRHETSELNYRCGICWRRLSNQEELDLHLLNHNNLKYKCEFCEEAFARKHLLNDHIVWCHTQHGDAEEELKTLMTMGLGDLYKE